MPGGAELLRDSGWGAMLSAALDAAPPGMDAWMDTHTRLLKADAGSCVGLLPLGGEACCLKFYRSSSIGRTLAFRCGVGRGVRSFDRGCELAAAGIRVPESRACLRVAEGMLLLTEGLPGAVDLRVGWTAQRAKTDWERVLGAAGRALAELHAAGFAHGDCKWSNLLWSDDEIVLVDLDSARRAPKGSSRGMRDLARFILDAEELALPPGLCRTFIDSYAATARFDPAGLPRAILPSLDKLRRRHLAKYGFRGQRLL